MTDNHNKDLKVISGPVGDVPWWQAQAACGCRYSFGFIGGSVMGYRHSGCPTLTGARASDLMRCLPEEDLAIAAAYRMRWLCERAP